MAPVDPTCVVILDQPTAELREAAHEIIRTNANGWWHRMPDIWIVGGIEPRAWRDLLQPVIARFPGSSVFVLRLPAKEGNRSWSYFGVNAKERMEWIHDNYLR